MLAFELTPYSDESLNGYLLRLAEENFLDSASSLLRPSKVRFKASYSVSELSEIADTFELCGSVITNLAAYEQVNGSLSENQFLRTSFVPVCTQCLDQAAYIRQPWHHQLLTACPEHKVMLLAVCPECNEHINLKRSSVTHCRCGFNLVNAPTTAAPASDLLVSRLLVRGNSETCQGLRFQPKNIDAFVLFLANLTLPVAQRKNAPITWSRALEINMSSYEFAVDLLPRFAAWVKDRVLDANRQADGRLWPTWERGTGSSTPIFRAKPMAFSERKHIERSLSTLSLPSTGR